MLRGRITLWLCAAIPVLAACAGSHTQIATPGMMPQNTRSGAVQSDRAPTGPGNIYWNKHRLRLPYPSQTHAQAVLTYWAPDGYYTLPVSCNEGGKIAATPHRKSGNPSGYMHAVYWFKARTPGPDNCSFTAILNNTGSPPIAVIKLHIDRAP